MQWKKHFFLPDSHRLKGALLCLLEREQQDEPIDQSLIQNVIDAFLSLCLKDANDKKSPKECLRDLEALFLEAAGRYQEGETGAPPAGDS